jgi:hypothetical protein
MQKYIIKFIIINNVTLHSFKITLSFSTFHQHLVCISYRPRAFYASVPSSSHHKLYSIYICFMYFSLRFNTSCVTEE